MAPNNALGKPTAAKLRAKVEGQAAETPAADPRIAAADSFGAGDTSVLSKDEVTSRGVGTLVRTPIDEFMERPRDELRSFFTGMMFLTRLPCPGWCDHHPGYLMRGMAWFPLLGALVGVWAAAIYDAAASLWPPLVAAALSAGGTLWLTGCFHEDGLCDTLDGFGGGWTRSQIMRIMRDSRNGSYATMGGCLWVVAKAASLARLGELAGPAGSVWALGGSVGAGPAIIVGQCVARASSAPLIYFYEYIVDDEDAKGEYYNWFGESRRLLGPWRVGASSASAAAVAFALLPPAAAAGALCTTVVGTAVAGAYGHSILGGVMGDYLGASICLIELAIYLSLGADLTRLAPGRLAWLAAVLALPQAYGRWARGPQQARPADKEC